MDTIAENFLRERINSLIIDANNCLLQSHHPGINLRDWHAPFPILLYCFSTIDLLGQLLAGNATKNAKTTQYAKKYMLEYMRYENEDVELIQEIFRHKLVHLAQPAPKIKYKDKEYSWCVHYGSERAIHLNRQVDYITKEKHGDFMYNLCIGNFIEDIHNSVFNQNTGYLNAIYSIQDIKKKFITAYNQITMQ